MRLYVAGGALLAVISAFCGCAADAGGGAEEAPLGLIFPYQRVGVFQYGIQSEGRGVKEPSGILYHEERHTLFIVGDEGTVAEIEPGGTLVRQRRLIPGADFEGITSRPATGMLYIAVESEAAILEVDPQTLRIIRRFEIARSYDGRALLTPAGNGIEGIAFVPAPDHPHGGTFYVAHQSFEPDTSAILEVKVPLSAERNAHRARIVRRIPMDVIDLSGLHFHAPSESMLVVSDSPNVLIKMIFSGRIAEAWAFPGNDQEGIALAPGGRVFVAQDSGGVLKIRWLRKQSE